MKAKTDKKINHQAVGLLSDLDPQEVELMMEIQDKLYANESEQDAQDEPPLMAQDESTSDKKTSSTADFSDYDFKQAF